jgi:isoquinoline 1-oxidoreductase beta subunit
VKCVDDAAAKAVKGVRQIVRLDDAVAVVADHMGAAKKGLAALAIEWDGGPHAKLTTPDIVGELEKATLNPGAVAQNVGDVDKARFCRMSPIFLRT